MHTFSIYLKFNIIYDLLVDIELHSSKLKQCFEIVRSYDIGGSAPH